MIPFGQTPGAPSPSRILGADGKPYQRFDDSAQSPSGPAASRARPADDMPLPHVLTFSALLNPHNRLYYAGLFDEAMKHSRQDAVVLQNDCFLTGLRQERTLAVTSLPWHLEIDDEEDPIQVLVRDHLTEAVRRTPRFRGMLKWLHYDGTWIGRTAAQLKYAWAVVKDPNGAPVKTLTVARWMPVNGDKINHTWDHCPTVQVNATEELPGAEYAWSNQSKVMVLRGTWRDHFLVHRHGLEDTDFFFDGVFSAEAVHGTGLRSKIFWWNWIRLERLSQVSDYLERVGLGITLWYYELGNPASEAAVGKAAKEQSGRVNILLPRSPNAKGQGLERVETPVSGAEAVSRIAETLEWYIERYIVGQKMSSGTDSAGSLGGTGRSEFAADTKSNITEDDAGALGETMTGSDAEFGLVRHLHRHTFPQYAPGMPDGFEVRFKLGVKDPKAKERLEAIKTVVDLGVDVKADEAREAAGLGKPKEGDELCQGRQPGMGMGLDDEGGPPQPEGAGGGKSRKGDWNPFHGPRGGLWERNRQSGTVRHPRSGGGGARPGGSPSRFRMGADGRPQWAAPWRFMGGNYNPNEPRVPAGQEGGGEWTAMGADQLQQHHETNLAGLSKQLGAPRFGETHAQAVRGHAANVMGIQAEMQRRNLPDAPAPSEDAARQRLKSQLGLGEHLGKRFDQVMGTAEAAGVQRAGNIGKAQARAEYERRAVDLGFSPRDLGGVVEDMRKQDLAGVQAKIGMLRHAQKMLKHYGTDPGAFKRAVKSDKGYEDAPSVKGLDVVASSMAKMPEFAEFFAGHATLGEGFEETDSGAEHLLDMLREAAYDPPKPLTEEDLHEEALAYLEQVAASRPQPEEQEPDESEPAEPIRKPAGGLFGSAVPAEPDTTFDPSEFDEPAPAAPPNPAQPQRVAAPPAAEATPAPGPAAPTPAAPPGNDDDWIKDLPQIPAGATPKPPQRPGRPMHANDILLPSFAERARSKQGDARDILESSSPSVSLPYGVKTMPRGAVPPVRRHGLREALAHVFRFFAGGQVDRFAKAPPGRGQRGLFDADQPRVPAGSPEGGQWTDEQLGAHGDAIHAHAQAGDHGHALGLFRDMPHPEAKRLVPELEAATVAGLDAAARGVEPSADKVAAAPPLAAIVSAKEPHKMTWDEFKASRGLQEEPEGLTSGNVSSAQWGGMSQRSRDQLDKQHQEYGRKLSGANAEWLNAVVSAVEAGEAVPEHIKSWPTVQGEIERRKKAKQEEASQPWTMTREQWVKRSEANRPPHRTEKEWAKFEGKRHGEEVKRALAIGQAVSPEVLADYPDLTPNPETPSAAPAPAAAPAQVEPSPADAMRTHWQKAGRDPADLAAAQKAAPDAVKAWWDAVQHHKGLPGITAKLKHRKHLEAAFAAAFPKKGG